MSYHYSNPTRENDPHALPDVEVFNEGPQWFYAFGFPGCLWDSDPVGPFGSESEALADAVEG
jgi:hypothetical protein